SLSAITRVASFFACSASLVSSRAKSGPCSLSAAFTSSAFLLMTPFLRPLPGTFFWPFLNVIGLLLASVLRAFSTKPSYLSFAVTQQPVTAALIQQRPLLRAPLHGDVHSSSPRSAAPGSCPSASAARALPRDARPDQLMPACARRLRRHRLSGRMPAQASI